MKVTTKLALTAAITSFVASPAFADNNEVKTPSASVEYEDLDLNSDAGRETLDRRVNQAIRTLCNAENRGVSAQRRATQCRLAARASATPQVRFAILDAKGTTLALNSQAIQISQPQG